MASRYLQVSLSWYISLFYEQTAWNFYCLVTRVKLLCHLTIHKLLWCYDLAKSFECCLLNLLPPLLLLIPPLLLLIASLIIVICFKLIIVWFRIAVVWLHMLLHMFQVNLHLNLPGYLSSLKLLDQNWLFWECLLLLVGFSLISHNFSRYNLVGLRPMKLWSFGIINIMIKK